MQGELPYHWVLVAQMLLICSTDAAHVRYSRGTHVVQLWDICGTAGGSALFLSMLGLLLARALRLLTIRLNGFLRLACLHGGRRWQLEGK